MTSDWQSFSTPTLGWKEYDDKNPPPEFLSKVPQATHDRDVAYDFGLLDRAIAHEWNYDIDIINTSLLQNTDKVSDFNFVKQPGQGRDDQFFPPRTVTLKQKFISASEELPDYESLGPGEEPEQIYEDLEFFEALYPYDFLEPDEFRKAEVDGLVPALNASIPQSPKSPEMSLTPMTIETNPKKHLTRMLPLILEGQQMNACADSGASYNTIDFDLALSLQCKIEKNSISPDFDGFKLPIFGRKIQPVGKVTLRCQFPDEPDTKRNFEFYVFERLINPLIMGRPFLRLTKTLDQFWTEHETLRCFLNGELLNCVPDTGAEVNLMSSSYAMAHGFIINNSRYSVVQFADGTTQRTLGPTCGRISLGSSGETVTESFEVLEGLEVDVILGEEILWRQDAFIRHSSSFEAGTRGLESFDMGPIGYLGTLENTLVRGKEKVLASFGRKRTKSQEFENENEARELKFLDDRDTQELNRQHYEALRIFKLSGLARQVAKEEEVWKRKWYEQHRNDLNVDAVWE